MVLASTACLRAREDGFVLIRFHQQIHPGINGGRDLKHQRSGQLVNGFPVGNHQAFKAEFAFEHVIDPVLRRMHLLGADRTERHHDTLHIGVINERDVGRQMQSTNRGFIDGDIALVDGVTVVGIEVGTAIGHVMLGRR
jgi:hypothetical protein